MQRTLVGLNTLHALKTVGAGLYSTRQKKIATLVPGDYTVPR
jgi:hypothetical protein